ncbi:hypothetical protein ACF0H5_003567 [Mactra antiquata]
MVLSSKTWQSSWTVLIVLCSLNIMVVTGHFYGGAVSYSLTNDGKKTYAHIELITNWELGKGPCGTGCTTARIDQSTKATRAQLEQANTDSYFGHFSIDVNNKLSDIYIDNSNFTETVYAVDEIGGWEQDYMRFTIEVLNDLEDFNYEGSYWRPVLQSGAVDSKLKWHLQTVIKSQIRSDTHGLNSVPRVISKPIYQVKLDTEAVIAITAVDADGDYIKCEQADFHDAGTMVKANGVEVKDCKVFVNASSTLGYTNDAWIVVAVKLNDYNKQKITFGTDSLLPIKDPIAYSYVQFLVNILTDVKSPIIIEPSLENGHPFIVYAGATWIVRVYAQASSSRTIADFRVVSLDKENFVKSIIKDGNKPGVKYVEITWQTTGSDVGRHLFCISAIDDEGHDSDLLCYKLEVRANTFTYRSQGQATFIDVPSPNEGIECEADVTCLLPVYVRSSSKVKTITVGQSFAENSKFSSVRTVTYKNEETFKATLSFSNPSKFDPCDPDPCDNGNCVDNYHKFFCFCGKKSTAAFKGDYCEININDCEPTSCTNNGICKDRINGYECDCHSRYEGNEPSDCSADKCHGESDLICDADAYVVIILLLLDKCRVDNCHGNGVCSVTEGCTCIYGYMNDENCTQSTGLLPVTGAEFLDMSPKDGELYTCFVNDVAIDCHIPLYLVVGSGTTLRTVCLQLEFVSDPLLYDKSFASVQKDADVKFLPPTLNDGSRLTCNSTERCMLMFYTEQKGATCQNVLSPTKGVTVFPTQLISGVCVTEVAFKFAKSQDNKTEICFQSTKNNFQQRCYKAEVPSHACQSSPCQNDGHCFRSYRKNAVLDYQCLCKKEYSGDRCEKESIEDSFPMFQVPFTSIARPKNVECVQYQTCGFTLMAETADLNRPKVVAGHVDTTVELSDIKVVKMKDRNVYSVKVMFTSAKEGEHLACIQTISESGENQDELCFKVNIVTDVSLLYGFKDRPHFKDASLPMNSEMECVVDKQCHVLYHLTIGDADNGASVTLKKDGNFDRIYHYTTCTSDMSIGANCSVDVIIIPTSKDVGNDNQVCVGTTATSSNIEGEERCFTVTTVSQHVNEGCQKLHCKNGGFCDGHEANNPLCYCPLSYSGGECDRPVDTMSTTFLGDLSLPSDIHCAVGESCSIPFETLIVQNETADVRFTRIDSDINAYSLSCVVTEYSDTLYMGVATFKTDVIGSYKACLLTNDTSVDETDELCLMINAVNASEAVSEQSFDKTKPHFVSPTLPADSTVFCATNKTCHLDLHFTNGDKFGHHSKCPTLIDTSETKDGRKRVLVPQYKHNECISDIVYLPPTITITSSLCVQLVLPGLKGENRCFDIKVVSDASQEKMSQCTGSTCDSLDLCQDGQVGDNCKCKVIRKNVPTDAAEDSSVPIALIAAGVGSAVLVVGSVVTGFIIYKMKKTKGVQPAEKAERM